MKKLYFIGISLLCLVGTGYAQELGKRVNGWYKVMDGKAESLSVEPIATVKDFCMLRLDSIPTVPLRNLYYISGQLNAPKSRMWEEVTSKWIGKQIAFVFNGRIISMPQVQDTITNGYFSLTGYDITPELYDALRQEMETGPDR